MISIVMPSYLGPYKGAARNREKKLVRAIHSVLNQTSPDWQLVIVADGCEKTMQIVTEMAPDGNIKLLLIDKMPLFSGAIRNTGIDYADGDWICYLDIDDIFAPDHIKHIQAGIREDLDWLFFDDYTLKGKVFQERACELKLYQCGTSNVAHRKAMKARWDHLNRYGHDDWKFICKLVNESKRWARIRGEYVVCHIPYQKEI